MHTNRNTLTTAIAMNPANPATSWFIPLIDGSMTPHQWLAWLMEANAERKDGTQYPAIYAVNGAAPLATSQVVKSLWAAQKMGFVGYAHAVHQCKCFQAYCESATHALAGQLRQGAPEVPAASVLIKSENSGGNSTKTSMRDQIRESLEHVTKQFNAGQITDAEYKRAAIELGEQWQHYQAAEAMGDGVKDNAQSSNDSVAGDEGALQVALHSPQELWRYAPSEILGSEALMINAAVQFGGIDLPLDDPDWGEFLDRLGESLAITVDYAEESQKTEAYDKSKIRLQVAQQGMSANPKKARWVVNHLSRRLWRDAQTLQRQIESMERQKETIAERIMQEERYNLPARMSRVMDSHPIDSEEEPKRFYMIWEQIDENDLRPISFDGLSQGQYQIETLSNAQGRAQEIIDRMNLLYTKVRAVDEELQPIWTAHASEGMPNQPPIYWNHRGFYITEDEAIQAMEVEIAERNTAQKAATIDGAASVLEQMLAAQGLAA